MWSSISLFVVRLFFYPRRSKKDRNGERERTRKREKEREREKREKRREREREIEKRHSLLHAAEK